MIHVVTVHHRSEAWIDIQRDYLRRHLAEPFETWANLEGVEHRSADFDHVIPALGLHAAKLNLLAAEVTAVADPNDVLIFLDGDAFPIADPMPVVRSGLADGCLVAVRRDENVGDRQPHPCFAATTVGNWAEINGDWSPGHPWAQPGGKQVTDVGGNLLRLLELHDKTWTPLLRTNAVDWHPVFFGVYGGVVYHHGAGFRRRLTRADLATRPPEWLPSLSSRPVVGAPVARLNRARDKWWARTRREAEQADERREQALVEEMRTNHEFYRRFV